MKYSADQNTLTLYFVGRLETATIAAVEEEVDGILSEHPGKNLIVDAEKLTYISSSGLRLMLRLRKSHAELEIVNVSPEIYEIFDMTRFTEIMKVRKAMRRLSIDGCPLIGCGAKGSVYRLDKETIIKVYRNPDSIDAIRRERNMAQKAFLLGIPTAISYDIVRVNESYGSVFELLDVDPMSRELALYPEKTEYYVSMFAELLKIIHATAAEDEDIPDYKTTTAAAWVNCCASYLSDSAAERLIRLVREIPDRRTLIHGDYHANNIMVQNEEPILIDMDTLSCGHPIFELANIYVAYVGFGEVNPSTVEDFLGISYATACRFWKRFSELYFGKDYEMLADTENKIRILAYARILRHYIRRGEQEKPFISELSQKLEKLLADVDSLSF